MAGDAVVGVEGFAAVASLANGLLSCAARTSWLGCDLDCVCHHRYRYVKWWE